MRIKPTLPTFSRRQLLERAAGCALVVDLSNVLSARTLGADTADVPHAANWLKDARLGVFMRFLPGDAQGLAKVEDFDVPALTQQLKAMGASYFVLTLGQNAGFFNSPNAVYDGIVGAVPGGRHKTRHAPTRRLRVLASASLATSFAP